MGTYINAADLETALTTRTYTELYAPSTDDAVDTVAVDQDINSAEALVDSYLLGVYSYPLDPATDRLIIAAALLFARAYAFMRHPEYVRTFGEVGKVGLYQQAHELMLRVQAAKQRLPDVAQVQKPKNIGGLVTNPGPILIGNSSGDF